MSHTTSLYLCYFLLLLSSLLFLRYVYSRRTEKFLIFSEETTEHSILCMRKFSFVCSACETYQCHVLINTLYERVTVPLSVVCRMGRRLQLLTLEHTLTIFLNKITHSTLILAILTLLYINRLFFAHVEISILPVKKTKRWRECWIVLGRVGIGREKFASSHINHTYKKTSDSYASSLG